MKWVDTEDIAIALDEKYPEQDPLSLRFTELHKMIVALDDFEDDPKSSNEAKLEAILMAWLEERND